MLNEPINFSVIVATIGVIVAVSVVCALLVKKYKENK